MINNYSYFIKHKYADYFSPELTNQTASIPTNFYSKRKKGENDSEISELIREDKIKEFIIYVNKNNISLNSQIHSSIYETNSILIKSQPKIIEYATFYGSIQIFEYLYLNGVKLSSSLWVYGIHGCNPEIIHILEKQNILPDDKKYFNCLFHSIECFKTNHICCKKKKKTQKL